MKVARVYTPIIIRAACGDAAALAKVARHSMRDGRFAIYLTALLRCDRNPHPLALLTALALHANPPDDLQAAASRFLPEAMQMLASDACADLRSALCDIASFTSLYGKTACDAAIWISLTENERRNIADAARDSHCAAKLLLRIGVEGWRWTSPGMRAALIRVTARSPAAAADVGGALWRHMDENDRIRLARSAGRKAVDAAVMLQGIGWDGWSCAPDAARKALFDAICRDAMSAAHGGSVVWAALDDQDRIRVAYAAADDRKAAKVLLWNIGSAGWKQTPPAARARLLDALCSKPSLAATSGAAIWDALTDDERDRIVSAAARVAAASATLVDAIGEVGWANLSAASRRALVIALSRRPQFAVHGCAVWRMLADDERDRIARAAARSPYRAIDLIASIGRDHWERLRTKTRMSLVQSICSDPQAAVKGGGAVWDALNDEDRARIALAAANDAASAAELLQRLRTGRQRDEIIAVWRTIPAHVRTTLIDAMRAHPWEASRGGGAVWDALNDEERARIALAAANNAQSAANLIRLLGRADVIPDAARTAMLDAIAARFDAPILKVLDRDPLDTIVAAWSSFSSSDRESIAQAAARCNTMEHLVKRVSASASASEILPLLRAVLYNRESSLMVARVLCNGAPWRDWMFAFVPDVDADVDVKDAWRPLARHLPAPIAAALLTRRSRR